ncbi:MAG: ribonuclease III [Nitrococcus mobilis]|nr:ribonuclease III [Nitrococcus mobilis]
MTVEHDCLQEKLGYRFSEPALLVRALTHRSACGPNNERLEFLGDSVLNFVVAAEVFDRRKQAREGELSRLRAKLVNQASLADIARELELGEALRLGGGEMKAGGQRRDSILSDTLEAIVGAIYLDAGFATCREVIRRLYGNRLRELPSIRELKDPKTRLQEHLQSIRLPLPEYRVLEIAGRAHAQTFRVECRITGLEIVTRGLANSRRQAEQKAAASMLQRLEEES